MARQTFDIGFCCRNCKANRLGLAPIELTIVINQVRTYISLQMKAHPADFKLAMQGKGFPQIQEYCRMQRIKVDEIVMEMSKNNVPLSAPVLKQFFLNGGATRIYTLQDLFSEYLNILSKRVGRDLSQDTYNRYQKTTKMFLEYNNIPSDTPVNTITLQHLIQYQVSLNEKLDTATSCNYLQKIKTFFNYAFKTGKINADPCFGLKIDKGVKETVLYLTEEELDLIKKHSFSCERLQNVADIFLFSCYTGLAWADISTLKPEDYKKNKYGYTYIEKERVKTGVKFCAILLEDAKKIAEKYNYNLPIKSGQKTNEYLKEIGTICELPENKRALHFHMARHTAAAYLLNYRPAIPNETIMRIMGWKNEKQLRHYAKMFNSTLFDDIDKAFGNSNQNPNPSQTPNLNWERITEYHGDDDSLSDIEQFNKLLGI